MGPRTVILCISNDELTRLLQKNVFAAHGYRVLVAHDAEGAESLAACGVDVVVGDGETNVDWPSLTHRLKLRHPHIGIVLTGVPVAPDADVLMQQDVSVFELLEQVGQQVTLQHARKWAILPAEAVGLWKYITS